jgi:hypothetical protein
VGGLPRVLAAAAHDDAPGRLRAAARSARDLHRHDPNDHGPFYWNVNVPAITDWQSNTTYALSRETTRRFFPMPLFGHWGPDDPYQASKRAALGIPTVTCEHICYHQWHPTSAHPSDEQICREAADAL